MVNGTRVRAEVAPRPFFGKERGTSCGASLGVPERTTGDALFAKGGKKGMVCGAGEG